MGRLSGSLGNGPSLGSMSTGGSFVAGGREGVVVFLTEHADDLLKQLSRLQLRVVWSPGHSRLFNVAQH